MKIYLYSAISDESAKRRNDSFASTWPAVKLRIAQSLDWWAWRLFGQFRFRYYRYAIRPNSNVGDIAIRYALHQELSKALAPSPIQITELAWDDLNSDYVDKINNDGDLFVIGGSGYYQHDIEGILNAKPASDVDFLKRLSCPIAAIGVGVNCVLRNGVTEVRSFDITSADIVRRSLGLISLCMVRDERSRDMLQKLTENTVVLAGDAALFLEPSKSSISAVANRSVSVPRIGINFPFHGPHSENILRDNFSVYARGLSLINNQTGCKFIYFQHSDAESLIPKLLRSTGLDVEVVSGDPRDMLNLYASLTVHLCGMLHSAILCTNAGTPCVNLAYDIKNREFFRLMGIESFLLDPSNVTSELIAETLLRLINNNKVIRELLAQRKGELRAIFEDTLSAFGRRLL